MLNQMYIGGQWVDSCNQARFATLNPATEAVLSEVPRADAEDVDRAVRAAHEALHGPWGRLHPAERGKLLARLAEQVASHLAELAELETLDMGRPLQQSEGDIGGAIRTLEYNAGAADKIQGDTIPIGPDHIDFTLLEPLGVTAHITPWNSPLSMAVRSVAPALAMGCTVILKPAEQAPLSTLRLAALAEAVGFPPGVLNVVTGFGPEAGAALVRHPDVRGITFTGSVATGRQVMGMAAEGIKPVVMELGGKSPLIIFPDADLDKATADALRGFLHNCGQVCVAARRLILHRDIRAEVIERLRARLGQVRIGPGLEKPDLGPLVSAEQRQGVLEAIRAGEAEGARLVYGGQPPAEHERGYFVAPTIFDEVTPNMRLAREEIFGPLIVALEFETEAEALRLANDSSYGLAAGIYTRDLSRALRMVRAVEAGIVWVNDWYAGGAGAPVGGYKESGLGRERGLLGLMNYVQVKNVAIRI